MFLHVLKNNKINQCIGYFCIAMIILHCRYNGHLLIEGIPIVYLETTLNKQLGKLSFSVNNCLLIHVLSIW